LERRLAAPVGSARKACSQYGEKDTAMDLQLAGKRALVTGSSSGIGSEIARKLAAEGIGVVVHGRNAERTQAVVRQIEDAGGRAAIARGDLMTEDGKAAVIDATRRAFGGFDILGQQRRGGEQRRLVRDHW
jgi:3-oxoacyl-[acyl-carrier protein] reductase